MVKKEIRSSTPSFDPVYSQIHAILSKAREQAWRAAHTYPKLEALRRELSWNHGAKRELE